MSIPTMYVSDTQAVLEAELVEAITEYLNLPVGRFDASLMDKINKLENAIDELERLL